MAKADSKQKNVRLRMDAWFEVEDLMDRWRCSRDVALERAIHEAHGSGIDPLSNAGGYVPTSDRTTIVEGLRNIVAPPAPGVIEPSRKFTCDHCQAPRSTARYGGICDPCRGSAHANSRASCPVCTDYGTGAL